MTAVDFLFNVRKWVRRRLGRPSPLYDFDVAKLDPGERHRLLAEARTDLARTFYGHDGRTVHKWTHYLDAYDRHFRDFRGQTVTMLEIGVQKGGSLELWREYLGPAATIFGVDVDPACADRASPPNQIRIGSQADPRFLRAVVAEAGAPDIVLDDGSHIAAHQRVSFEILFPLLKEGGLYVMEDLHTSYWPGLHRGGYRRKGTALELVKQMIDDMHGWYHARGTVTPAKTEIAAIHVYDSIVFIEKAKKDAPKHIKVGGEAAASAA